MKIDYSKISKSERVIALIREKELIEKEITAIDKDALILYELERLQNG